MTKTAQPVTSDRAYHFGGVLVARVCCGVVAILLVAAIVYGAVMALGNYAQIAV